ncbi:acyl-CoA synthetase (AMP-forming)/AMP-acid ligase II [Actinocorallia herbida]|uniref:Acyl-CoA synthetase (AMP-forming)/AMP-acid ligase II n=1 Tax=Actinocorallia herbida TaxID=58109 RepID=A0A3N1CZ02_9ACTN|nr:long-chain-fatty-acid--CoA ligase [Actinocorallia herbida]ROO86456.1 acyl-CoA synthetase (AMP-forming)/AMP-acid ligase II [Actinocorallia herbida]
MSATAVQEASPHPHYALHADGTRVERFADLLRRRAAATPDLPAVLEPGRTTTFGQLEARASRVARALLADGVGPGDRVAYIGVNSAAFLEVLHGAAKIGAIATAVNNRLHPREVLQILRDAEPSAVVFGAGDGGLAPEAGTVPSLARVVTADAAPGTTGYEAWLAAAPDGGDPGHRADPEDTALIFYTSGTTGLPKGIMLSGRNLGQALATMHYGIELDTTSVAMAPIPYFHVSGFGLAMVALVNGAALLLELAADPEGLRDLLIARRVSHAALVPTLIQRLIALPGVQDADWSALKYVVYGASPIPLPVIHEATRTIGCKFLQSYGLTESTGGVTMLAPADHLPEPGQERRLVSAGRPMLGVPIQIVDPETLKELPAGERGEVVIGGGHVMQGYWRRPEATAEALLPDGRLRTGDGGSFDEDGFLYLHDRLKDMIVTGGENVYPAEVESVLTEHPSVLEAAVIGIPSARWGESPYAIVVRRPGARLEERELIAFARERLAHFKCPSGVAFCDALPRNASGKLLKNRLRETHR